jgi:hypothetical protein
LAVECDAVVFGEHGVREHVKLRCTIDVHRVTLDREVETQGRRRCEASSNIAVATAEAWASRHGGQSKERRECENEHAGRLPHLELGSWWKLLWLPVLLDAEAN